MQAGEAEAKHPPSAGAQSSAARIHPTPPGLAATPVPSEVIRLDGTPIAPDRPPLFDRSAPPAQAPKTAAAAQPASPTRGRSRQRPPPLRPIQRHQLRRRSRRPPPRSRKRPGRTRDAGHGAVRSRFDRFPRILLRRRSRRPRAAAARNGQAGRGTTVLRPRLDRFGASPLRRRSRTQRRRRPSPTNWRPSAPKLEFEEEIA